MLTEYFIICNLRLYSRNYRADRINNSLIKFKNCFRCCLSIKSFSFKIFFSNIRRNPFQIGIKSNYSRIFLFIHCLHQSVCKIIIQIHVYSPSFQDRCSSPVLFSISELFIYFCSAAVSISFEIRTQ